MPLTFVQNHANHCEASCLTTPENQILATQHLPKFRPFALLQACIAEQTSAE